MTQQTTMTRPIGATLMLFVLGGCEPPLTEDQALQDPRPNILLIMADDMGYTDIGSFGSEIRTPNLDALALSGVRLTNYHVCSPMRVTVCPFLPGSRQPRPTGPCTSPMTICIATAVFTTAVTMT